MFEIQVKDFFRPLPFSSCASLQGTLTQICSKDSYESSFTSNPIFLRIGCGCMLRLLWFPIVGPELQGVLVNVIAIAFIVGLKVAMCPKISYNKCYLVCWSWFFIFSFAPDIWSVYMKAHDVLLVIGGWSESLSLWHCIEPHMSSIHIQSLVCVHAYTIEAKNS